MPLKRKIIKKPEDPAKTGVANPVEDKIAALADEIIERAKNSPEPEVSEKTEPVEVPSDTKPEENQTSVPEIPPSQTATDTEHETEKAAETETDQATIPVTSFIESENPPPNPIGYDFKLEEGQSDQGLNKKIIAVGTVFIAFILLAFAYFNLGQRGIPNPIAKISPTPSLVPSTPTPSFIKSNWTLEILNGTKTPGLAKKAAQTLENRGYKILKTGNADNSNYAKTQLFVSKAYTNQSTFFLVDINSDIKITSVAGELKDSTATARIILGKE